MSSLLRLERQIKYFLKPLRIRILLFLPYALGIETTNTFVHFRSSFIEKLYSIPDQNGQNVYPFLDRNGAIPITFGAAHSYMSYLREYYPTPHPPPPHPPTWLGNRRPPCQQSRSFAWSILAYSRKTLHLFMN